MLVISQGDGSNNEMSGNLPPIPDDIYIVRMARRIDWKRLLLILLGLTLFALVYLSPPWPDAIDPEGESFPLSKEGSP